MRRLSSQRRLFASAVWVVIVIVLSVVGSIAKKNGWIASEEKRTPVERRVEKTPSRIDGDPIAELVRNKRSNVIVEASGTVVKILPDDRAGDRHQKFLVEVGTNTVLIAHNIDLAPRVTLREGDAIRFKGEYEYTDRGGVIHWTHHDPAKRRAGGWIEHNGKRYE